MWHVWLPWNHEKLWGRCGTSITDNITRQWFCLKDSSKLQQKRENRADLLFLVRSWWAVLCVTGAYGSPSEPCKYWIAVAKLRNSRLSNHYLRTVPNRHQSLKALCNWLKRSAQCYAREPMKKQILPENKAEFKTSVGLRVQHHHYLSQKIFERWEQGLKVHWSKNLCDIKKRWIKTKSLYYKETKTCLSQLLCHQQSQWVSVSRVHSVYNVIIVTSFFQTVVGTNLSYVSDFIHQENTKVLILALL